MKHFVSIAECTTDELNHVLDVAGRLKKQLRDTGRNDPLLAGRTLAMIFEKPSLRTRVSFAVAMTQLGGNGLLLRDEEVGLGKREPIEDVARVLSGMCDGIMARTFEHEKITGLAKWASVPVINGLTDYSHPCQALADLMTLGEHFGISPTVPWFTSGTATTSPVRWPSPVASWACGLSLPRPAGMNCRRMTWIASWPRCPNWIGNWSATRWKPSARPTAFIPIRG